VAECPEALAAIKVLRLDGNPADAAVVKDALKARRRRGRPAVQ
jgi:hypothetical protein